MIAADFPNPPKPPMVACPHCNSQNEPDRSSCRNCQKPMSGETGRPRRWVCEPCATSNDVDFHPIACRGCGAERPASPQRDADAARAADIAAVVAEAPPLTAQQIVTLRRIFSAPAQARPKGTPATKTAA